MQYTTGTVDVTNNSNQVTGTGTQFVTAGILAGVDRFKVRDDLLTYDITSVGDETTLYISPVYAGATQTDVLYQIARDFSLNRGYGLINPGDRDWPVWLSQALNRIDSDMASVLGTTRLVTTLNVNQTFVTIYTKADLAKGGMVNVRGVSTTSQIEFGDIVAVSPLDPPSVLYASRIDTTSGDVPVRTYQLDAVAGLQLKTDVGTFTIYALRWAMP